jgi:adenine phosphoribosyltransferase
VSNKITDAIRSIEDFPKPGIIFRDITTLLNDVEAYQEALDELEKKALKYNFNVIAAMEARGFFFGAALADRLKKRFVPIRKPGKLPFKIHQASYDLEYGSDRLEVHIDAFKSEDHVLIIDDLLATGGTAKAATDLVEKAGASVSALLFLIELDGLSGRALLKNYSIESLVTYKEVIA